MPSTVLIWPAQHDMKAMSHKKRAIRRSYLVLTGCRIKLDLCTNKSIRSRFLHRRTF